ncbi:molybdopterin molybdenumtransferase MoeA [Croceivirga lutea]|uniref:molybdopterin molybdotransferase MoeA n=1 Tax=Croceivirga lutea TaxID=1775167 RepID=UPI00163AC550|nr:molybdopterin molybdotransferase MoeA [Croceivirga lutea]GGG45259.1 molybdopterin molybdenumtransferase MoeA [Croceivirga lutea]
MIDFEEALQLVLNNTTEFGVEKVAIQQATGRCLAEDIFADTDFPPFNRVVKDGIAINYEGYQKQQQPLKIEGVAAAGDPQKTLENSSHCFEVMTGVILPKGTDTVVMYEQLTILEGYAKIEIPPKPNQEIHTKGSDEKQGALLVSAGRIITAAEIGVLASVGKEEIVVKKHPKIAIISTGDELVDIHQKPEPHQIRKSNSFSLQSALQTLGISSNLLHFQDVFSEVKQGLEDALITYDVVLLSGGVSKGKFDYLPKALEELGVEKLFHKVKQRPGKPFWFGRHYNLKCTVFALPGNPVSTFVNFHIYVLSWFYKSIGLPFPENLVTLKEDFENKTDLTLFVQVAIVVEGANLTATFVKGNGSGDLTSLVRCNGFVKILPKVIVYAGEMVSFYPVKNIV